MTNKVAILIDGGFFLPRFRTNNAGRNPRIADLQPFINDIMTKVRATNGAGVTDVLFRTFWYDCRPYGGQQTDPNGTLVDFSIQPQFTAATAFQKDLKTFPQLALRLGDLSFDGWKVGTTVTPAPTSVVAATPAPATPSTTSAPPAPISIPTPIITYKPDFKQKAVDMKIGLDIAWMSSKRTVDKIVLIAGDSDFVSPMKFARREGLLVYLHTMRQTQIKMELKEHSDFII